MKNRFIESLNSAIIEGTREAAKATVDARAWVGVDVPAPSFDRTVDTRHSLFVTYNERVSEAEWGNPMFRNFVRHRAAKVLSRHLYGDMENRLRDALEALWADGMYRHEAATIIEEVIATCRGEATE